MPMRARRRRRLSGSTPGGRPLSRTALATIVRKPAVRKSPSAASTPPSHGGIGRSAVASATTGTVDAARSGGTGDIHRQQVRRRRHEPQLGSEKCRIARHGGGGFRRRRPLQPDVPLPGAYGDAVVSRRGHAGDVHGHLRASGNDAGQPDADTHVVRTGSTGEERVGAADVRHRERGEDQKTTAPQSGSPVRVLCTLQVRRLRRLQALGRSATRTCGT